MPHPSTTAQHYPHRPAIIIGDTGEVVSYRELDQRSNRGAHLFRALGLCAGDHIGMMVENNRQFLEIAWAAQRAGIVFTPIATHLKRDEIVYILRNCGARLFIGSQPLAEVAEEILCERTPVEHYLMVGGGRTGFISWDDAVEEQPSTPIPDQGNGVPMVYSSGTTGLPKGVFVPPTSDDVNTPTAVTPFLADALGFQEDTVYLNPAPLYHAGPLHYCMMTLYQGGTVVLMQRFSAETSLKLIERYRVTHSQWAPIMFIRLLKLPRALRESYDTTSMRVAVHSAASCPVDVKEAMLDWWGDVLLEYYASSEGVGLTMISAEEWLEHPGSVGKPAVGNVHIVGPDGTEQAPGEVGLVYFSGDHVRFTYFNEPEKTAEAYTETGWATAGDIGYVSEDGYLYLSGRESFTIISGGVNIYPQEVENVMASHEKVADVAVIGVPNAEFGEEVKAIVEPVSWTCANAETADEILDWLRERISPVKMPRSLEFHPSLPRQDNGKLYKQRLLEAYLLRDSA